jgi:hypothetical protein
LGDGVARQRRVEGMEDAVPKSEGGCAEPEEVEEEEPEGRGLRGGGGGRGPGELLLGLDGGPRLIDEREGRMPQRGGHGGGARRRCTLPSRPCVAALRCAWTP